MVPKKLENGEPPESVFLWLENWDSFLSYAYPSKVNNLPWVKQRMYAKLDLGWIAKVKWEWEEATSIEELRQIIWRKTDAKFPCFKQYSKFFSEKKKKAKKLSVFLEKKKIHSR